MTVTIRPLAAPDLALSSRLHRELLDAEFLVRCGDRFLFAYHRAWIASPYGIGLCATDTSGEVIGVLLGAVHPESHYRYVLRQHGAALGWWLTLRAITSPRFAGELAATRLRRYSSRLWRIARSRLHRRDPDQRPQPAATGEVVHLMVRSDTQGQGVGRRLLEEMAATAKAAGCDELVLVTPTDLTSARAFYEHLGWEPAGVVGKAGERFMRYRTSLLTP